MMDRRDFLKNSMIAVAGAALFGPMVACSKPGEPQKPVHPDPGLQPLAERKEKMKVLMINGSARADGNTFCALSEAASVFQKQNIDSEILQIGAKPVRFCIACGACMAKKLGKCVFDDDLCNVIVQKMAESDALIVGTPVYYGQPNGGVMALMQRVFFSAGQLVQNKPAAAVAVCRRGGATAAFQSVNMMFQMMNMPVVTSQYWNIVYGRDKGEAKLDTEGMQTMRTLASNMSWLLQNLNGKPVPEREASRQFMSFIR